MRQRWLLHLCWVLAASIVHKPHAERPRIVDIDPPNETQGLPLESFNVRFTFSEAIQAGAGSILVTHLAGAVPPLSVLCSGGLMILRTHALVPINQRLQAGNHKMQIPPDCFRSKAGEPMNDPAFVYSFTSSRRGTSLAASSSRGPRLREELSDPSSDSWVSPSQKFTFVFTEAVQAGDASVSILQSTAFTSSRFLSVAMDKPTSIVEFNGSIPGLMMLNPGTLPLSAAYSFEAEAGALRDPSGLPVGGSGFFGSRYTVQVSAGILLQKPLPGQASGVSRHTSIVLEFDTPVAPGSLSSEVALCTAWRHDDPCATNVSVPEEGIYFIGRFLILRPAADLQPGQLHNVSLPSDVVRYFGGFLPNDKGAWEYRFTVDAQGAMDSEAPELITGFVDCSTVLGAAHGVSQWTCTSEDLATGFTALPGQAGHSSFVPIGSEFKLYFSEKVEVSSSRTATLQESGSSAAPIAVAVSVGSGPSDIVVTLVPELQPCKRYTLSLASGVVTDSSVAKNAYSGNTFSFFVPLSLTSSTVAGAVNIPKQSTIGLTFDASPLLGSEAYFTIWSNTTSRGKSAKPDLRTVELTDIDQVLIQGRMILLTPRPSLLDARTYSVSLSQNSLQFLAASVVLRFHTRVDDTRKPVPIHTAPTGVRSKFTLDKIAPSVRFSEEVKPFPGRRIIFRTVRRVQYIIDAADRDCGFGGTAEDACVETDMLGSKVSFYPLGKLPGSSLPAPWAISGTTYHIKLEAGAFNDAVQLGAVSNEADELEFVFRVSPDVDGPLVVSEKTLPPADGSLSGHESSVFLTFNEIVEAGDSDVSIRVWDHLGTRAPSVVAVGPESLRRDPDAGWRQTVVLSFDAAVQAASSDSHQLQLYDVSSQGLLCTVPVQEVSTVSNLLLFNISTAAAVAVPGLGPFYVRSTSAGAVISSSGVSRTQPLDTRGAALFEASATSGAPAGSGIAMLWNSAQEFVCFGADGILPDMQVYMSQQIASLGANKTITLYECGKEPCDGSNEPLWTLDVDSLVVIDAGKPFRVMLQTSKLLSGTAGGRGSPLKVFSHYRLDVDAGAFHGFGDAMPLSAALSITFSVCEARFGTPASPLLRVYSPRSFSASPTMAARRFEVVVAKSALVDQWGNPPAGELSYEFMHEAVQPVLEPNASNPPNAGIASPTENVILAFSEVVQCGTGFLELWDLQAQVVRFEIDVARIAAVSANGQNAIADRYVSITPKTLCDGSPPCTDLVAGQTYYLKTSQAGVFKDRIGNKLPQLDTRSTWRFSVSTEDTKAPEVSFVAGQTLLPPHGIYPSEFVGYMWFTEQVIQNAAPNSMVTLQDCGADLDCSTAADNSVSYLPAELSFGDGTGISGYGLMRYSRYLTRIDRMYRVNLTSSLVSDIVATGTSQSGPSKNYIYDVCVGVCPKTYADKTGPKLGRKFPVNTGKDIAPDAGFLFYFNEDVQRGSGVVKLCLNGAARVGGNPDCVPATWQDGTPAEVDVSTAVVDRRRVDLAWPKMLGFDQRIFVLLPKGLFKDDVGNPSDLVEMTMYSFTVRHGDRMPPQLDYYYIPISTSEGISLHFNEAVQLGTGVHLVEATSHYTLDKNSCCCPVGHRITSAEDCSAAFSALRPGRSDAYHGISDMQPGGCSFCDGPSCKNSIHFNWEQEGSAHPDHSPICKKTDRAEAINLVTQVSKNIVSLQAPWKYGGSYQLELSSSSFQDLTGNLMEESTVSIPFRIPAVRGGPFTLGVPDFNGTEMAVPANGSVDVVPSTTFKLFADQPIQAGSGSVSFGSVSIPIDECVIAGPQVVCDPPGYLEQNQEYIVTFPPKSLLYATGNKWFEDSLVFTFTTINVDLVPPALALATDEELEDVHPSSLLTLHFNEVVQAGSGIIFIEDARTEAVHSTIDVQRPAQGTEVYFQASTLHVAKPHLVFGQEYLVRTYEQGVLMDEHKQPLGQIAQKVSVLYDDKTPPTILASIPRNGSSGEAAPSNDILLYFSEAVQAISEGDPRIKVSDGVVTENVPVGRSSLSSGSVTISESVVRINPYRNMGYGQLVTVSVPANSFADLSGNLFAGTPRSQPYQWQTATPVFEEVPATSAPPPARAGAVLQLATGGLLLLHGGRTADACHSDTYTSSTGADWTRQSSASSDPATPLPAVADAASASNASGCVWMLGGQCSGIGTSTLWRTCSTGAIWDPLPRPTPLVQGADWPESLSGQAIAVLGGWQLVVVDLGRGDVWVFQDPGSTSVVRTAAGLAFAPRRGSSLLVSSSNDLYLVGGHNCNDWTCSTGKVFMDVWKSAESFFVGRDWECLTSNYAAGLSGSDLAELGRQRTTSVMTYDDTIYLLGGQRPGSMLGVATAFTSMPGPRDLSFDAAAPRLMVPLPSAVVYAPNVISLYFGESVHLQSPHSVKLLDLLSAGGTEEIPFNASTKGQMLQLHRGSTPKLIAGHTYQVVIPDGALADAVGNKIVGFPPYQFSVSPDGSGPNVSVAIPTGSSVPPWTTFTLEADEELRAGSGSLNLSCIAGASYQLPVSAARLVGRKAFFELPQGSRLTEGQQYTLNVPAGLFLDAAGNIGSSTSSTFSVLSGVVSSSTDGYAALSAVPVLPSFGLPQDTRPPRVIEISPPPGATDVPSRGAAILVRYSEQVKFGDGGAITVEDVQTGNTVDGMNVSDADSERLTVVTSGVKLILNPLEAGASYSFSIPVGVVTDLSGNPAPAVTAAFTCLSGKMDTEAPSLVMTEPAPGALNIPSDLNRVTMWFSEPIKAGNGSIAVVPPTAGAQNLIIPLANATIYDTRLQISLPEGALEDTGTHRIELPAGLLQDELRTAPSEGGGNALQAVSFTFATRPPDTLAPSLLSTDPVSETLAAEQSFALPASSTLLLTFSETVQAGAGAATLIPQTAQRALNIDVKGSDVVFAGAQMLIVPPTELLHGEVYSLRISDTAVADVAGNYFAGLAAGDYVLSTVPRILFEKAGTSQFARGTFKGERYSVGATVDSANNVYVIGGADGSAAAAPNSTLQDVWRLETHRQTQCGAYFSSALTCSRSSCSGNPPTLGRWNASRHVWRSPSIEGRRCYNAEGMRQARVGDLLRQASGTCPCPKCPAFPSPSPTNMVNTTYVDAYDHELATDRALPLLCRKGYVATGSFRCYADTVFAAKWRTPLPSCEPKSCKAPPPDVPFQDPSMAGALSPCAGVSKQNPLPHDSTCAMRCLPGYQPKGVAKGSAVFKCVLGAYTLPVCEPQKCVNRFTITNGTLSCGDGSVFQGGSCIVLCHAGFEIVGRKLANCSATSLEPESTPVLTVPGFCRPRSCGNLELADPLGEVLSYANGLQTTGSEAFVGCATGYIPSDTSFNTFQCISNSDVPEEESGWVGALKCVRRSCSLSVDVGRGYFSCGQPRYGQECKLVCELGFVMHGGNGVYKCEADGRLIGTGSCREIVCPELPLNKLQHVIKTDCPPRLQPGAECEVTQCRDGFEPRGSFMCKYGGFNKMPACISASVKADIKWYYLSAITLFCDIPSTQTAEELVSDPWFWQQSEGAIADGLNEVTLSQKPIVDNVVVLNSLSTEQFTQQGKWRIWITFRVRSQNVSVINTWLGAKQALVKARFKASMEVRVQDLTIYSMLLAPAEVAIAYSEQLMPKTVEETDGFFDRLTNLENTDTAEVALGAMVGIILGLIASLICVCAHRRYFGRKVKEVFLEEENFVEQFLAENQPIDEPTMNALRQASEDVQRVVVEQGPLAPRANLLADRGAILQGRLRRVELAFRHYRED